jgi:crotonobetainyl-CoA:carnitine CoA-transferase CaiB-like acyl-CoA transferase
MAQGAATSEPGPLRGVQVTLDLKSSPEQRIALDLLRRADIAESFRPGTLESLGLARDLERSGR